MTTGVGSRAVVIGASIAGLCAARVLSAYADRVAVIDRDQLPRQPEFRKGVSQSRHLHILMQRGLVALERLFPGLESTLLDAGAVTVEWPRDALWLMPSGWSPRFSHGVRFLSSSRHLLEWLVRERVTAIPNVEILESREVTGLLCNPGQERITGVACRAAGLPDSNETDRRNMTADLVVDASGVRSRLPGWLEEHGYPAPDEIVVDPHLGYATRLYQRPANGPAGWKTILLQTSPPEHGRGGGLFPIEGGRWIVTLSGFARDYPPVDEAGFLDFARTLRSPALYDAIKDAKPVDAPIRGYRHTGNRLRHFRRTQRFPERLLVLGDALCSLNPAYAQGMSVAASQALVLGACLAGQKHSGDSFDGLAARFRSGAETATKDAWRIATSEDGRYPTTDGEQTNVVERAIHWYMDRVMQRATHNATVNEAFVKVLHLMQPPRSLFQPDVLLPTLFGGGSR